MSQKNLGHRFPRYFWDLYLGHKLLRRLDAVRHIFVHVSVIQILYLFLYYTCSCLYRSPCIWDKLLRRLDAVRHGVSIGGSAPEATVWLSQKGNLHLICICICICICVCVCILLVFVFVFVFVKCTKGHCLGCHRK